MGTRKRNNRKRDNRTYGEKVQDNLKYALIRIATNKYVITFGFGVLTGALLTLYMIKDIIG